MSQENVEVVRRLYSLLTDRGAWRRREYDHVFLDRQEALDAVGLRE
jgi:hypothetical protein